MVIEETFAKQKDFRFAAEDAEGDPDFGLCSPIALLVRNFETLHMTVDDVAKSEYREVR